jgi:hypothetical protein
MRLVAQAEDMPLWPEIISAGAKLDFICDLC